jgi:hypothetical protein
MDLVPIKDLTLDWEMYPRESVSLANITSLRDALSVGAKLPPIVAWKGTGRVVDGWHRVQACRFHYGEDYPIRVDWREYQSPREAFIDSVALNATHGRRLQSGDWERIYARAQLLKIPHDQLTGATKVPIKKLRKAGQTTKVAKGFAARTTQNDRLAAVRAEHVHDQSVIAALEELARRMTPEAEIGPSNVNEYMKRVADARKTGDEMEVRLALLDVAALFVWWAARTGRKEREAA